jgi:hypothetical protein
LIFSIGKSSQHQSGKVDFIDLTSMDLINWELVKRDHSWDNSFKLLVEYMKQHGNCKVPRNYQKDPTLGRWLATQRKQRQSTPEWES